MTVFSEVGFLFKVGFLLRNPTLRNSTSVGKKQRNPTLRNPTSVD